MKISLVFIGSTGAGPVYSYEMAKALAQSQRCKLQVIISENVCNLNIWKATFENTDVDFHVVKTYNRSKLSVLINTFNFVRKFKIYSLIKQFHADVLYSPFVLMWERFLFSMLHRHIRIVKTIHDVKLHDSFHNVADFFTAALNWGSMHFVDDIVLLNNKDKAYVEKEYGKGVVVIPHACLNYYFDAASGNNDVKKTIGFFGRIEPYKGLDVLVEAYEKLSTSNVSLLIAGSGRIEPELLNRINKNKGITLMNRYIRDEEFQPLLDKVDFVVLPYKRASQSGVIPMCFADRKTVVATNVGALSEQVPEGTGILVSPQSDHIAQAIDDLYGQPERIAQLANSAYEFATKTLTWSHSADLLIDYIENNLKTKK